MEIIRVPSHADSHFLDEREENEAEDIQANDHEFQQKPLMNLLSQERI